MSLQVAGIGISAPGLADWPEASAVLRGDQGYVPAEYHPGGRSPLSGPERRRATAVTRLALEAAMEAAGPDRSRWDIPSIFTSSGGEVDVCDLIFTQLAEPGCAVSPTQFHNSVHNAASGYWSIASGSHRPTTSLACYDDSFAAGLIEAAALLAEAPGEVLLVAFDQPPPFPIGPFRPLACPFAGALRLASGKGPVSLSICFDNSGMSGPTVMADPALERMRAGNPAARALPLLAAIARQEKMTVIHLPCGGPGLLRVVVSCLG
jgi:hypothetical protein